jgi:hypothetical protein
MGIGQLVGYTMGKKARDFSSQLSREVSAFKPVYVGVNSGIV